MFIFGFLNRESAVFLTPAVILLDVFPNADGNTLKKNYNMSTQLILPYNIVDQLCIYNAVLEPSDF